jgi:hypothetical protein
MPAPNPNGHIPEPNRPPQSQADHCGGADLISEAEALRGLLQEASARAGRLLAALKQQRRQSQAVRQAMQSLQRLQHLGG